MDDSSNSPPAESPVARPGATRPPPPPPRTPKGERRRLGLIAATARALNRRPYPELKVTDITEEAEAPVGAFYRHFRNKTEAVLQALDQLVEDYRATLPHAPGGTFFSRQVAVHRNLIQLFGESPGLLGCYYSYDSGERAFTAFFCDRTLRFDREHAADALQELGATDDSLRQILPVAHALTCMTDNVVFRLCTGRDDPIDLPDGIDPARVLGVLRYRGFLLRDPPEGTWSAAGPGTPQPTPAPLAEAPEEWTGDNAAKRLPKRSDSAATYEAVLAATLRLLNAHAYEDVRISDIEHESGITRGSIYHYFGEKRDIVLELVRLRLKTIHERLQAAAQRRRLYHQPVDDLVSVVEVLMEAYRQDPGVLRVLYQMEQRDPQLTELFRAYRALWIRWLAGIVGNLPGGPASAGEADIVARALLAMLERFAYDLFVYPAPELREVLPSAVGATEFLAAIWARMVCLSDLPRRGAPARSVFEA